MATNKEKTPKEIIKLLNEQKKQRELFNKSQEKRDKIIFSAVLKMMKTIGK